jgi:hypothetical protein
LTTKVIRDFNPNYLISHFVNRKMITFAKRYSQSRKQPDSVCVHGAFSTKSSSSKQLVNKTKITILEKF